MADILNMEKEFWPKLQDDILRCNRIIAVISDRKSFAFVAVAIDTSCLTNCRHAMIALCTARCFVHSMKCMGINGNIYNYNEFGGQFIYRGHVMRDDM